MQLQFGDVILDPEARQLWSGGREVKLSPKAFDLLTLLIERRPRAVSKAEIHQRLWPGIFVSESSLPSLVSEIREAIADRQRSPHLIRTLYGRGYAFQPPEESTQFDVAATPDAAAGWLIGEAAEIPLRIGETVLGREGPGVTLLRSTTVSRRHARLSLDGATAVLEDLGSKNGTYVNDQRISGSSAVADGDRIRIGSLLFTFRRSQPAHSTETQSSRTGTRL